MKNGETRLRAIPRMRIWGRRSDQSPNQPLIERRNLGWQQPIQRRRVVHDLLDRHPGAHQATNRVRIGSQQIMPDLVRRTPPSPPHEAEKPKAKSSK